MSEQPDLSIIIPAYNEATRIGATLEKLADYLKDHPHGKVEVIVVVARSRDKTLEIARSKAKLFRSLQALDAGEHAGKGRDVRLAMLEAKGRYRMFMDADLATPLHHLEVVQDYIDKKTDVIIGTRNLQVSHQGLRKFISSFGNFLVRFLLRLKVSDTQCGFKAFRAQVAEDVFSHQTIMGWGFDMEVLAIAVKRGYSLQTIPIDDWKDVAGGTFKNVAVTGALSTFTDLLKIKWQLMTGKYREKA